MLWFREGPNALVELTAPVPRAALPLTGRALLYQSPPFASVSIHDDLEKNLRH
jgi:hypothetical protein